MTPARRSRERPRDRRRLRAGDVATGASPSIAPTCASASTRGRSGLEFPPMIMNLVRDRIPPPPHSSGSRLEAGLHDPRTARTWPDRRVAAEPLPLSRQAASRAVGWRPADNASRRPSALRSTACSRSDDAQQRHFEQQIVPSRVRRRNGADHRAVAAVRVSPQPKNFRICRRSRSGGRCRLRGAAGRDRRWLRRGRWGEVLVRACGRPLAGPASLGEIQTSQMRLPTVS